MEYTFKTNINCGSCERTIASYLNEINEIKEWSVDLNSQDKLLRISSESLDEIRLIAIVNSAGFDCASI